MARKPPPEPIDHHYDIPKLTKVFAITSLIALPVLGWMVWQDYGREWKTWQKKFVRQDRLRTRDLLKQAAAKIDPATESRLLQQKREGTRELRRQKAALAKAQDAATKAEGAWYAADQIFRFRKAEMDTARYHYEVDAKERPKAASTKNALEEFQRLEKSYLESQVAEQAAKQKWDAAKRKVAQLTKTRDEAVEALNRIDEDYDRWQAKLKTLRQNDAFYLVRNAPIADMLAPSLKIEQVQLDGLFNDVNFLKAQRVDRCMTCHIASDKRGFEDKEKYANPLRTHPRLDLFVDGNSPHPYATFGCTSCHGGRDGATDFVYSGHMPNDYRHYEELEEQLHAGRDEKGLPIDHDALEERLEETQAGRWMKRYGWQVDRFNDLPMYPMKAVEAGCYRCHRGDANHVKSPKLDEGKKLVENLGCWGCHNMKGFEGLPRVGPALDRLAAKTTPEWTARWLSNPRAFRHSTKMPRFFYLSNFADKDGRKLNDTMIAGVVAYLFEKSHGATAPQAASTGDAANGKLLFESLGCQGCHMSDPAAERKVMDGWRQHGPNLVGLAEKTNAAWIVAWLKNPKSINPETRMPNLRLTDQEAQDIAAHLLTRPASSEFKGIAAPKADEAQRDSLVYDYLTQTKTIADAKAELAKMSPHQKDLYVGEKIIGNYGCYACHAIPGFENAKPIGVELSEWGGKPVHLLDFGFVHLPHTRADWFEQKVKEPRSFDKEKVKTFQEKLKMPQFSLSEAEVRALQSTILGFLRDDMAASLKATPKGDRVAMEAGRRLVKEYNCQGCHILEDRGGQIRETLADAGLAPPNIRGEGAKVQSDWLFEFVNAPKNGQIRPWLKVRMPTFQFTEDQLNTLTHYFAAVDKAKFPFMNRVETLEARSRAAGTATFEQLKCSQCHPQSPEAFQAALAGGKTPADLAPILSAAHSRLRYDWINDWIKRPEEWMPGTRMPTNFPKIDDKAEKRMSPLAAALDAPTFVDYKKRLVDIWGSEEEAKAFISDPDRVTKALRDHIWSLGNTQIALTGLLGAAPDSRSAAMPSHPTRERTAQAPRSTQGRTGGK